MANLREVLKKTGRSIGKGFAEAGLGSAELIDKLIDKGPAALRDPAAGSDFMRQLRSDIDNYYGDTYSPITTATELGLGMLPLGSTISRAGKVAREKIHPRLLREYADAARKQSEDFNVFGGLEARLGADERPGNNPALFEAAKRQAQLEHDRKFGRFANEEALGSPDDSLTEHARLLSGSLKPQRRTMQMKPQTLKDFLEEEARKSSYYRGKALEHENIGSLDRVKDLSDEALLKEAQNRFEQVMHWRNSDLNKGNTATAEVYVPYDKSQDVAVYNKIVGELIQERDLLEKLPDIRKNLIKGYENKAMEIERFTNPLLRKTQKLVEATPDWQIRHPQDLTRYLQPLSEDSKLMDVLDRVNYRRRYND